MGTLLNYSFLQFPQNFHIPLPVTFSLFKGDDVCNFLAVIFSMAVCFIYQRLKQFLCMLLKRDRIILPLIITITTVVYLFILSSKCEETVVTTLFEYFCPKFVQNGKLLSFY